MTLVVPVYNEAESIATLVGTAAAKIDHKYQLLAVYDSEDDSTLPVLRKLAPDHPEIKIIKNAYGRGALEAIRTGLEAAPPGAVVVTMADLSDDLSAVNQMYALYLEGFEIVCGSRYMRGGRQIGGPIIKRTMSRVAGLSLRWLTRIPTHDVTNSFKLYSRGLIDEIEIESTGGFEIGMELVIKAWLGGHQIAEVPARWTDRTAGKSNFSIRKLLMHYINWYLFAIRGRAAQIFGRGVAPERLGTDDTQDVFDQELTKK